MEAIRVLICDDHAPFRAGLKAMLALDEGTIVCGEQADGLAAVEAAERLQPDIVLMDLSMPQLDGLEATRRIVASSPHIRVLVLTMSDNADTVFAALQAGARGFVVKGALRAEIVRSIYSVHSGEVVFGAGVANAMLAYFAQSRAAATQRVFPQLTPREQEILDLMARNLSNGIIAERLGITIKTVRNHVSNVCTKLQVADRTEAILRARGDDVA